jgi:hypothetical protein
MVFLSATEQRALATCFSLLAEDLNGREIRERMGQATLALFRADHFASYVWSAQGAFFDHRVGINLHALDDTTALGDLRIWRGKSGQEFDTHDKELLNLIEPAFVAALRRAPQRRPASREMGDARPSTPMRSILSRICVPR